MQVWSTRLDDWKPFLDAADVVKPAVSASAESRSYSVAKPPVGKVVDGASQGRMASAKTMEAKGAPATVEAASNLPEVEVC